MRASVIRLIRWKLRQVDLAWRAEVLFRFCCGVVYGAMRVGRIVVPKKRINTEEKGPRLMHITCALYRFQLSSSTERHTHQRTNWALLTDPILSECHWPSFPRMPSRLGRSSRRLAHGPWSTHTHARVLRWKSQMGIMVVCGVSLRWEPPQTKVSPRSTLSSDIPITLSVTVRYLFTGDVQPRSKWFSDRYFLFYSASILIKGFILNMTILPSLFAVTTTFRSLENN